MINTLVTLPKSRNTFLIIHDLEIIATQNCTHKSHGNESFHFDYSRNHFSLHIKRLTQFWIFKKCETSDITLTILSKFSTTK